MKAQMHLSCDMSWTHIDGRWRTPGSWTNHQFPDLDMFEHLARTAERGCFDMMFFGDGTGIPSTWKGSIDDAVKWGIQWPRQDMSPYISALSRVTKNLGFCLTYASTFQHPFYVARLLNSLDHITNGRIALNVVTSTRLSDFQNYGYDQLMDHDQRYDLMEEFIDVCQALWNSVESDAFIWDRDTGQVADPNKVNAINHNGRFFKVKGPLNTVPSPQGRPVLIQAGGSPRGIRASAHFADHVFASHKNLPNKLQHRAALDQALIAKNRDPAQVGILSSLIPIVADSKKSAQQYRERMLTVIPKEAVGAFLSHDIGYDFSQLPKRFVPWDLAEEIAAAQNSPVSLVSHLAKQLGPGASMDRDDFFHEGLKAATGYYRAITGTASDVADWMEEQFDAAGARGGFMISHPYSTPGDLERVVDILIPELQRRGRFRTKYTTQRLKDTLSTY
jgi:FMN-dependent oxidoreductase (nitrilotriacetate monooxygenase family)